MMASFEHCMFVDADDYVEAGYITDALGQLSTDSQYDIVFLGYRKEVYGRLCRPVSFGSKNMSAGAVLESYLREPLQTGAIVWSTALLKRIGGWDSSLAAYQDIDLAVRALMNRPSVAAISKPANSLVYVQHDSLERISNRLTEPRALSIVRTLALAELAAEKLRVADAAGILGPYYRALAINSFMAELTTIGKYALSRARDLGASPSHNSVVGYLANSFIGEERKLIMSARLQSILLGKGRAD
jgi:hypothetical protein